MQEYTRGEVCAALGIPKTTLRRWEVMGKVKPRRNERGIWLYTEADVRKLERMRGGPRSRRRARR
jgi:DNA-binding transcriptional MerR regulator